MAHSLLPAKRTKATWTELGFNKLARVLLGAQALSLLITILLFRYTGLTYQWSTLATLVASLLGGLVGLWVYYHETPGSTADVRAAHIVFVAFLMISFTQIGSPFQYSAIALKFPYVDGWLAAEDARLGIHVPDLAAWTRSHPWFMRLMSLSYFSLAPQLVISIVAVGLLRERERLWEMAFHFQVCLTLTLAALIVWPAACAPVHYGYEPTIPMARLMAQIKGLHEGTMTVVLSDQLEGLISMPSFHVAAAMIVTWAYRGYWMVFAPLVVLNTALAASTIFTGSHYAIDILGAIPLWLFSLVLYRVWGRKLLPQHPNGAAGL